MQLIIAIYILAIWKQPLCKRTSSFCRKSYYLYKKIVYLLYQTMINRAKNKLYQIWIDRIKEDFCIFLTIVRLSIALVFKEAIVNYFAKNTIQKSITIVNLFEFLRNINFNFNLNKDIHIYCVIQQVYKSVIWKQLYCFVRVVFII